MASTIRAKYEKVGVWAEGPSPLGDSWSGIGCGEGARRKMWKDTYMPQRIHMTVAFDWRTTS